MSAIKDYVLTIVGACIVCGALTLLAPSGRFEKAMRLVGGIFLLLCMVSPLKDSFGALTDYDIGYSFEQGAEIGLSAWDYSAIAMEGAAKECIGRCVREITGEEALDVLVEIESVNERFVLKSARVTVSDAQKNKATAIADYVSLETGIRPEVISG